MAAVKDMTELLNSTSQMAMMLRPTNAERRAGRFLRAPDHDAGTADAPAADADAPAVDADAGKADDAADQGGAPKDGADGNDADAGGDADDASLMGKGGEDDAAEAADEPQLPEKYELTAPEGFELNDDILAEVDPVFRELRLDNDQANKLMPLAASFAERIVQQQSDAFQAQATDWAKQAKNDPEIGKANWTETESLVAKALDRFVGPKVTKDDAGKEVVNPFRKLLDDTKLGNHPEMIRAWRKIGAAIGEDGDLPRSDAGAPVKGDRLDALYPNDVPKTETA